MQNIKVKIIICINIMICFLMITGCTISSHRERLVRQSHCIPPPFQTTESLNPIQERYRLVDVNKPIQEISEYYQDLLTPVDVKDLDRFIYGVWRMQELTEPYSGMLFDCYNSIDWQTDETGCIILHIKDKEETTIEYMWNLGEGSPGCSPQLER